MKDNLGNSLVLDTFKATPGVKTTTHAGSKK
jgi:hypothetical protein